MADFPVIPTLLQLRQSIQGSMNLAKGVDQSSLIEPLSDRELEVMKLIGKGADNQKISEELFITVGTVKSHVNHILRKLDAKNRTEAVAKLRKIGMDI